MCKSGGWDICKPGDRETRKQGLKTPSPHSSVRASNSYPDAALAYLTFLMSRFLP